jgi:TrmH family RNA methyltransferase
MLSKAKLKELGKLKTKKERAAQRKFLIEGLRLCEEAAASSWTVESAIFTQSFGEKAREKALLQRLHSLGVAPILVKSQDLARLSDTVTAQGIVCVVKTKQHSIDDLWTKDRLGASKSQVVLALDGISDPGNVGTLIRTADAFGVAAVLLSLDTVELYNPKVIRSTIGSVFHLPVFDEINLEETIPQMKKTGFRILGTHVTQGKSADQVRPSRKACLLIGSEAQGLSHRLIESSDEMIHIPSPGKAESLNVAVAGGILLYEVTRKQKHNRA